MPTEKQLKYWGSMIGRPQIRTEEGKKSFSEKMTGHTVSIETRRKIGLSNSISLMGNIPWNKGKEFPQIMGTNHFNWKGEEVGYRGIHHWIKKIMGSPKKCEHCLKEKTTPKSIQWANKSHQYKRELTDWISLCARCHAKYDGNRGRHKKQEKFN